MARRSLSLSMAFPATPAGWSANICANTTSLSSRPAATRSKAQEVVDKSPASRPPTTRWSRWSTPWPR